MAASNTFGKAKKSGAPRKAPKVKAPNPKKPNFMREADVIQKRTSPQQPMKNKKLSK
jgi:hypothetical protein